MKRFYAILRNAGIAFLLSVFSGLVAAGLFALAGAVHSPLSGLLFFPVFGLALIFGTIGMWIGILRGLIDDPPRGQEGCRSVGRIVLRVVGAVGLCAHAFLLFLILEFAIAVYDSDREFSEEYPSRLSLQLSPTGQHYRICNLMPSSARNIHVSGSTGCILGLGINVKFSCQVSEGDFVAFAQSKNYALATNEWRNVNSEASGAMKSINCSFIFKDRKPDRKMLTYSSIGANGGGLVLGYDRDDGVLYGNYSAH